MSLDIADASQSGAMATAAGRRAVCGHCCD